MPKKIDPVMTAKALKAQNDAISERKTAQDAQGAQFAERAKEAQKTAKRAFDKLVDSGIPETVAQSVSGFDPSIRFA